MLKKIIPVIILLLALGAGYKFVLAKPSADAKPKPKVEGTVYMLPKEFLVNLADGRFAKLQIGLVLAHDDVSAVPAGGHEAAAPPEGYGAMAQEAIIRAIVTDELTGKPADELEDAKKRDKVREHIVERIHKETDVHADDILFPDLTVQ